MVERELQTIVNDPVLGTLIHKDNYYEGVLLFNGVSVDFSVGTYGVTDVDARLERGRAIVESLSAVMQRAKTHAARNLLTLKNDNWEEEDDRVIELAEFEERIEIASVTLDHNGELVMYFDDGDLFFGHDILVTETADGVLARAEIQG